MNSTKAYIFAIAIVISGYNNGMLQLSKSILGEESWFFYKVKLRGINETWFWGIAIIPKNFIKHHSVYEWEKQLTETYNPILIKKYVSMFKKEYEKEIEAITNNCDCEVTFVGMPEGTEII